VVSTASTGRKQKKSNKLDFHMKLKTIKLNPHAYLLLSMKTQPASIVQASSIHALKRKGAFGGFDGEHGRKWKQSKKLDFPMKKTTTKLKSQYLPTKWGKEPLGLVRASGAALEVIPQMVWVVAPCTHGLMLLMLPV
jgi:hypothetical protein